MTACKFSYSTPYQDGDAHSPYIHSLDALMVPCRCKSAVRTERGSAEEDRQSRLVISDTLRATMGRLRLGIWPVQPSFRRAELVDEFVVDDGSGESGSRIRLGFFEAHDAALANDIAVLLAGDFFRHLENHLYQSIHRQLLWAMKEDSTLADVFDGAFIPGAGLVHAIA